MTTQAASPELGLAMEAALPPLDAEDRRLNRTLVRLLGEGHPVETERLADALGQSELEVADALAKVSALAYRDDEGRVIGFWGLALGQELAETPHRLHVDGRQLYGWCAFDTLFLPLVLGEEAEISSRCPTSAERITLTVSAEGVRNVSPPGAVLSALLPGDLSVDVIRSYCHFIHFFASTEAAQRWIAEHEGTFQLSIEDAFELARFWAARCFGVDLEPEADPSG